MLAFLLTKKWLAIFVAVIFGLTNVLPVGRSWAQETDAGGSDLVSRQATYRAISEPLDRFYAGVEALIKATDTTRFDVESLASKLGPNPDAMLDFVQREIVFEPYTGSLRGPHATLAGGAANSLDRSLLLAELLKRSGFKAEIARAQLSEKMALKLLQQMDQSPPDRAEPLKVDAALLQTLVQVLGIDVEELLSTVKQVEDQSRAIAQELSDRSAADAAFLAKRLAAAGIEMPTPKTRSAFVQVVSDHFWVRYQNGDGRWVDLEPSFSNFAAGKAFAPPESTFAPDAVPTDLVHQLAVRVVLRTANGTAEEDHVLVDERLAVPELYGKAIRVANEPLPSPYDALFAGEPLKAALSAVDEFASILIVGSKVVTDNFFNMRGDVFASAPGSDAGKAERLAIKGEKAVKTLGGKLEESFGAGAMSGKRIVEQWVEYRMLAPLPGGERADRTERRTIYRQPHNAAETPGDGTIIQDLIWSAELLPIAGPMSADQAGYLQLTSTLAGREQAMATLRRSLGLPVDTSAVARSGQASASLLQFASGLTEWLKSIRSKQQPDLGVFWDRANLVAFETSLMSGAGQPPGIREGYDIVALTPQIVAPEVGAGDDTLREEIGAFANALEWSLMAHRHDLLPDWPAQPISNTGELMRAAISQSVEIVTLKPDDSRAALLARLILPPDEQARVKRVLDSGQVVIAPAAQIKVVEEHQPRFGWWQVDLATGEIIGVMEGERGQATSIKAFLESTAISWVTTVLCFAGFATAGDPGRRVGAADYAYATACLIGGGAAGFASGRRTGAMLGIAAALFILLGNLLQTQKRAPSDTPQVAPGGDLPPLMPRQRSAPRKDLPPWAR